jgi:hypothetical protein
VDPAGFDFDDERDVQPFQCHGVDVEEVDCQQAVGLGAQEGPPSVIVVCRWRDPAGAQDFADGGGGDLMAEAV